MKALENIIKFVTGKIVFCGIDIHKDNWKLCYFCDGIVVEKLSIGSDYHLLVRHTERFYQTAHTVKFIYEAGFSGYHLYRRLSENNYECTVTPPNRVPGTNKKVKTDKIDAEKLAKYHAAGLLKNVYVPSLTMESDRQILRLRGSFNKNLTRVKNQIKSFLKLHGHYWHTADGSRWSRKYVLWLQSLEFELPTQRIIMDEYLKEFQHLRSRVAELTRMLRAMSRQEAYHKNYKILVACRGIGLITAMTFLLELCDILRFPSTEDFASYLGLTPSQYSSGEHVNLGHITREGNAHVRCALVESAWTVIRYDPVLREKYNRIRAKGTNGKKAIVAVARSLAVRLRRCLLDQTDYVVGIS